MQNYIMVNLYDIIADLMHSLLYSQQWFYGSPYQDASGAPPGSGSVFSSGR